MQIETKDFGKIEISPDDVVRFPKGIYAFEHVREFVFIKREGYRPVWMQAVSGPAPRLYVFDPADILEDYHPELPEAVRRSLKLEPGQEPTLFVIAVIPDDIRDMTVNLKSPVAVNFPKKLGEQVILETDEYPVRHPVFAAREGGTPAC